VHRATLIILAASTADVMTTETFIARTRAASAVPVAGGLPDSEDDNGVCATP
jgi:hypothetical protein